jgi:cell wall-associated NlpC family hydrolase
VQVSRRRFTGVLLAGLAAALCAPFLSAPAAYAKPHMPTDTQIARAKERVRQQAAAVGRLSAQVAGKDAEIQRLQDLAELAMEKYNKARADLVAATAGQKRTAAAALTAQREVSRVQRLAGEFVRASYVSGGAVNSFATLLSAHGPSQLLQQAEYLRYASAHQLDVLGQASRAKVGKANADSAARAAVITRTGASRRATRARLEAAQRVSDARTQLALLRQQRAALELHLRQARIRANGLVGERRRYDAWKRAQQEAAARERARQDSLRRQASAQAAAWTGPVGGSWTAAQGRQVAHSALRWLGTPYAWGGGNDSGPTYGVNGPDGGSNDGSVYGFDCSGLTLWAWAQVGVHLPHYAGYQYTRGRYHPSPANLRAGDLVFWSYDGTASGIHHVAVYLGDNQVIQAPQSGDVVRISPLWFTGYFGATRPGT